MSALKEHIKELEKRIHDLQKEVRESRHVLIELLQASYPRNASQEGIQTRKITRWLNHLQADQQIVRERSPSPDEFELDLY